MRYTKPPPPPPQKPPPPSLPASAAAAEEEERKKEEEKASLSPLSVRPGFKSLSSSSLGTEQVLPRKPPRRPSMRKRKFSFFLSLSLRIPPPSPAFCLIVGERRRDSPFGRNFLSFFFFRTPPIPPVRWSKIASKMNPHLMGDRSMYGKLYFRNKKVFFSQIRK